MVQKKYLGIEISRTGNILKRNLCNDEASRRIDEATGKNSWIIGFIGSHSDRDVFQRDIEEKFSIRRSTVSSMLKLMEKKGLIVRESVSYDARLKKLTLTPKAQDMYMEMITNINNSEKQLRRNISDEELEEFFRILEKIRKNAEGETKN